MNCIFIPVIINGATGMVEKLESVPGKHSVDSLQKTAVLGTSHIIRKVLQPEAWSLSGGDHCLSKTSNREKMPVTGDKIIIIIIMRDQVFHPYLLTLIISLFFLHFKLFDVTVLRTLAAFVSRLLISRLAHRVLNFWVLRRKAVANCLKSLLTTHFFLGCRRTPHRFWFRIKITVLLVGTPFGLVLDCYHDSE